MDGEQLLYDISELNHLFRDSVSIETLLDKAVEMVAQRTGSAVCSIYLFDPQEQELVLRATKGLNPEFPAGKSRDVSLSRPSHGREDIPDSLPWLHLPNIMARAFTDSHAHVSTHRNSTSVVLESAHHG